tara:strand:- start:487 stop:1044 length:558 start_codon:yes stop_codon:yes gene_type:complete
MSSFNITKESFGKLIAFFAILISAVMIVKWREYESKVLKEATKPSTDNIEVKREQSPETVARISLLEKMAMAEREKIKVMVEHDNSPLTNTYPMILDATNSYDPDVGDEVQFVWKQIAGEPVEIRPNPFSGKVSFEAQAGEYTFELTVSDDYGSKATVTRTVIIEPEPNTPPVIDMKIRQGSELN